MIKRIAIYCTLVGVLFLILFFSHRAIVGADTLSFSLLSIYLFNAIATVLTYMAIEITFSKLPDQTGYAFLAAVFLKLGLFTVLFMTTLTSDRSLELLEKVSILIPFGVFLVVEASACFKLISTSVKP